MWTQVSQWKWSILLIVCSFPLAQLSAVDQAQWGQRYTRNMVSSEKDLPSSFDLDSGKNIKWIISLGSESWATPVVAQGRVFQGTNNDPPRDPRIKGDRGVMLCLDEKDGSLLWQLIVPKLGPDPYWDWPSGGIVSPPSVEGDRVYVVSNRGEVMCLDIQGQLNGNQGPFLDEARLMTSEGEGLLSVTNLDADILWLFDIPKQAGIYPHDAAHSSILIDGDFLYVNTSNGVDNTHRRIRAPQAPSLIVLDKQTGRYLACDHEGIGPRIFHCTWSSPALGAVNGQKQIFFGGGDGIVYAFKALKSRPPVGRIESLEKIWSFDCDPTAPKQNVHLYTKNRDEGPSNIKGMPVFYNNRIYVAAGGDIWWGKRQAWLKCIDATGQGDVTGSAEKWSYTLNGHCSATPSIYNGLVFISDCAKTIHCIDAETGVAYWTHRVKGDMWGSTLVADGKVYVGTRRREFIILSATKEKKVLDNVRLDTAMAASPCVANGVLYVTSMKKLYAIQRQ
ncbi:PQQ-binding-like beta-propeller repeat protein [Planctomycetota bacterium]